MTGWVVARWRDLSSYADHRDARVAATNWVSLLVAMNQPFYPLYIWWIVGDGGWALALTLLSTPFFAAIPALARRAPTWARVMLPLVGVGNTYLAAKAFGTASGAELFLFPCAMAGAMAFRRSERLALLGTLGAVFAAYLALHDNLGPPLYVFGAEGYASFLRLNIFSVAGLTGLIALQFSGAD